MSPAELTAIVRSGESEKVEFKKTTGQRSDGAKTVCAMLNGQGGFVLFGVTDAGEVSGQQVSAGTMEDLVRELRRIEPQPLLNPERVPLDNGLELIVIPVPGRSGGPYTYEARPYIRQGPTTLVMPQDEYGRRLVERAHPTHRWEIQPAHGVALDDLDTAELVRTVDEAIRRLRLEDPGTRDPEALLRGFRLMHGDQPPERGGGPSSGAPTGSFRTTHSAGCGWLASGGRTRRSSWTTGRRWETSSISSSGPSASCATTCRSRAAWCRTSSSASTIRSTRHSRCAKHSPTPSATATTPLREAR